MEQMAISKFKATCLAVMEQVRKTGMPVRVTRRGVPVADVVPPGPPANTARDWLGAMAGTAEIAGDLTAPSGELVTWEAEHR